MLTIKTFAEACCMFRQGDIPFRLLQDQARVLFSYCEPGPDFPHVAEAFDISHSDIEWLQKRPEAEDSYCDQLGGNFHLCETEGDLQQIEGIDIAWAQSHGGKWPNVTEQAMSWDGCDYVIEKAGEAQYALFLLITNNAGGPVYYVPKRLWEAARVSEHIAATSGFWQSSSSGQT